MEIGVLLETSQERGNLRNFRWAFLFWIRLLTTGSVTSAQSSVVVVVLDLGVDCFLPLESRCFVEPEVMAVLAWVSESEPDSREVAAVAARGLFTSQGEEGGESTGFVAAVVKGPIYVADVSACA